MEYMDLYSHIAQRTDGELHFGLVGPVRTGKSTFIKRFMELMVLPGMDNPYAKARAVDEMPQSGAGKTIMTTQPHFVPNEAVEVALSDEASCRVRLVDCVGYMVDGALGYMEGEAPRMVRTPWFDEDIPFEKAAEIGTRKVIEEHATIGIVVTTDGSITEIPRADYIQAEERVVNELAALGKPYVVVINSRDPNNADVQKLGQSLKEKYGVPVMCMDVLHMEQEDLRPLLEAVLLEFPLMQVDIAIPAWCGALSEGHPLMKSMMDTVMNSASGVSRMRDYTAMQSGMQQLESFESVRVEDVNLGAGHVELRWKPQPELYYNMLAQECGVEVKDECQLMSLMKEMAGAKREYDRIAGALESVRETGYGLVSPTLDEMSLEEPEIVKQGNRYGVRLKASAPSLHMMRVDIQTEVSPIVGTEKQSEELVQYMLSEFENDPARIWDTNIFGKSLHDLVKEGMANKLTRMPEDAQDKIAETLSRIINEGNGGLICILL